MQIDALPRIGFVCSFVVVAGCWWGFFEFCSFGSFSRGGQWLSCFVLF